MLVVRIQDTRIHGKMETTVIYPVGYENYTHRIVILYQEDLVLLGQRLYRGYVIRLPHDAEVKVESKFIRENYEVKTIGDFLYIIRPYIERCLVDTY